MCEVNSRQDNLHLVNICRIFSPKLQWGGVGVGLQFSFSQSYHAKMKLHWTLFNMNIHRWEENERNMKQSQKRLNYANILLMVQIHYYDRIINDILRHYKTFCWQILNIFTKFFFGWGEQYLLRSYTTQWYNRCAKQVDTPFKILRHEEKLEAFPRSV